MNFCINLLVGWSLFAACSGSFWPEVKTVDELIVEKYLGRWYEMYSSLIQRWTFQRNSYCTFAEYSATEDNRTVSVLNSGRQYSPTGPVKSIEGYAKVVDPRRPGALSVSFPSARNSTSANYLVVKLGPSTFGSKQLYEYTIITTPWKALLWILARDPQTFREKYEHEVMHYVRESGYNWFWNRPRPTKQGGDCVYQGDITVHV